MLARRHGSSRTPTVAFDPGGRRIYANAAFARLVGYPEDAFLGERPPFPYHADPVDELLAAVLSSQLARLRVAAVRYTYRHRKGFRIPCLLTGGPIRGDGEKLGWIMFVHPLDLSALERMGTPEVDEELRDVASVEWVQASLDRLLERVVRLSAVLDRTEPPEHVGLPANFSAREREVAALLLQGYRVPAIGKRLFISPSTVRNHCKSMFRKLGVASQSELVATLRARGQRED